MLRNTLLARKLFYSSRDEEEGVPSTRQVFTFPASPLGTYPQGVPQDSLPSQGLPLILKVMGMGIHVRESLRRNLQQLDVKGTCLEF